MVTLDAACWQPIAGIRARRHDDFEISIGAPDNLIPLTIAIDKLDKVGLQGVRQELTTNGFSESQMQVIEKMFSLQGSNEQRVAKLRELLSGSEIGLKGCDELSFAIYQRNTESGTFDQFPATAAEKLFDEIRGIDTASEVGVLKDGLLE